MNLNGTKADRPVRNLYRGHLVQREFPSWTPDRVNHIMTTFGAARL